MESTREIKAALFNAKTYDRTFFEKAAGAAGIEWRFHEFRLSAETAEVARGNSAVCVFVNDVVDSGCLEKLKEAGVGLVALRCAGFNNVDLECAKRLGMAVTRVPAYSPHAVAEHTLGLLLTLNRKIHRSFNRVRELNFSLNGLVGFDIYGKTVGVIGTGKIGKIVAEIFKGFKAEVIAYDPAPQESWAEANGVKYCEMAEVLSRSDILTLHLPLTPQTQYMINADALAQVKRGAYLINTSRGKLIETTALIGALKSGQLGGVALDVYEEEEGLFFEDHSSEVLQDDELSRLLTFPNVLITAHQAFLTAEALQEIARVTSENIQRFANGRAVLPGTCLTGD